MKGSGLLLLSLTSLSNVFIKKLVWEVQIVHVLKGIEACSVTTALGKKGINSMLEVEYMLVKLVNRYLLYR